MGQGLDLVCLLAQLREVRTAGHSAVVAQALHEQDPVAELGELDLLARRRAQGHRREPITDPHAAHRPATVSRVMSGETPAGP
jgi:hypothetical protein